MYKMLILNHFVMLLRQLHFSAVSVVEEFSFLSFLIPG